MTIHVNVNGKKYVWDKHSPNVWRTEKGNVVRSKKLITALDAIVLKEPLL